MCTYLLYVGCNYDKEAHCKQAPFSLMFIRFSNCFVHIYGNQPGSDYTLMAGDSNDVLNHHRSLPEHIKSLLYSLKTL